LVGRTVDEHRRQSFCTLYFWTGCGNLLRGDHVFVRRKRRAHEIQILGDGDVAQAGAGPHVLGVGGRRVGAGGIRLK
jgi:hypothetical protein